MDKKLFSKIKKIERITFIFDFLAIVAYISLFLIFFNLLELPAIDPLTGDMKLDDLQYMEPIYELLGRTFDKWQMNSIISVLIIFMVVSVPMIFINIKKNKTKTIYDFDSYTAANTFIQAIINLITLNIVGFGLRIYNMFLLIKFVKGYSPKEFFSRIIPSIKEKFAERKAKKKELEEQKSADEYSASLKKSIRRQTTFNIIRLTSTYLFLVLMALIIIIPFYWMVLTSVKDFSGATSLNPEFFISFSRWNWVNYKVVLTELNFGLYIKNTVIVALFSTAGTILTTIFAAYAFARIEFKGRELLFSILIMTMMIPGELYIITNFITVSKNGLGWIGNPVGENNYFIAMIIPFVTSISYIFFLRQNFKQVPESLYKAARVDGCSDFKFLMRVMVPIASPTIFTITILNVFSSWNAYIWPRIITGVGGEEGKSYWLISNALRDTAFVLDNGQVMYNLQIAASALVTVPLLIVFFMFRKYIMNGIGRSGTKG
ncbi:MAG: carbohydrate ABC transporter permease [Candidatus Izemoplasmatales bacterium]|nr:carbohydrate ABC transporter permease [Candidatus Izemoplasmatales bacterium]